MNDIEALAEAVEEAIANGEDGLAEELQAQLEDAMFQADMEYER